MDGEKPLSIEYSEVGSLKIAVKEHLKRNLLKTVVKFGTGDVCKISSTTLKHQKMLKA